MPDNLGMWIAAGAAAMVIVIALSGLVAVRLFRAARDETLDVTQAVSHDMFVGRVAVVTLGVAHQGHPAQARLKDRWGQTHYIMVEPDEPSQVFEQGHHVLLVRRAGSVFRAIHNTNQALVD